ncbi:MAG TPA: hypothetical protein VFX12_02355 [Vicinamibacterales bacterium]|nr:hypothetical protein [Vicinamibacterales bacterium]
MRQTVKWTAAAVLAASAFVGLAWGADVLTMAGLTAGDAKEAINDGILDGYAPYSMASRAFKAASPAVRVQLVNGGFAWARTYVASAEFKQAYETARQHRKPTPPTFEGTPEEEFARNRAAAAADSDKSLAEMREAIKKMPPDQQKQIEASIEAGQAFAKRLDTPEMRKMNIEGIRQNRISAQQAYEKDLKTWQADFPVSPEALVATRLRTFLDDTVDVDFDAKLVKTSEGRFSFADPKYEQKGDHWKLAFRAGKDAALAARADAQAWLKTLQ